MELFLITIAWLFGILSGLYLKISIVLFVLISIILYFLRKKNRYLKVICEKQYIFIFIVFYLISYFQISYLEQSFNKKYENVEGEIKVVATIISNPTDKEYKTSYTIKIDSINGNKSYKNTKLLLNVKKEDKETKYSYGNKICFTGEFAEPSVQRNEGGFDYKEYLKTKGIYGIVNVESNKVKILKENNVDFISKFANIVSNEIEKQANKLLDEKEASLLTGILIGNQDNIDEDIKEAFRDSNLSHMLAVSGDHVSYVIMAITSTMVITKVGKRRGKIVTILILLFFILITGQTSSVTRACYMSIYILLASLFHKKATVVSSISISMLFLMIGNPYCIFDIGFQLSYGGTIGIIFFYKLLKQYSIKNKEVEENKIKRYLRRIKVKLQEMILLTISANIIILPIVMFHFNTVSFTFIISNLLASPFMGILVLLGFATIISSFIFYPIAQLLAIPLSILLNIFIKIAIFSSELPFSKILISTPKLTWIILYYFIIFSILYYKKIKQKDRKRNIEKKIINKMKKITIKKVIAILLIVLIISMLYKQIPQNLKIYFIDVGQGDSMLIKTPMEKTILIDGGGSKEKESFDIGEKILLPYLLDKGINRLDYVLITHFDSDHVGGILTILQNIKVEKVIICRQGENSENYEEFKNIVKEKKIKVIVVKKGDNISVEKNITLQILWPKEEQIQENILNNNSIVAKFNYNNFSMLLTGDIEEIAEKQILEEYKNSNILKSTILKVAHHGSKSSSIQSFLEKVKPKIALIGVGENNTFGHPNKGVIERLDALRCKDL